MVLLKNKKKTGSLFKFKCKNIYTIVYRSYALVLNYNVYYEHTAGSFKFIFLTIN